MSEREPWCESSRGSRDDPLVLDDLPFSVPTTGRYWIEYEGRLIELPESPAGSVLDFESSHSEAERG